MEVVSKAASWWGLRDHTVGIVNHGRGCDFVLKVPRVEGQAQAGGKGFEPMGSFYRQMGRRRRGELEP